MGSTGRVKREGLMKLTPKQRAFVEHYINNGGKGTEAAKAAGYSTKYKTNCKNVAHKLLKDPHVVMAIQAHKRRAVGQIATKEDLKEFWTEVMKDDRAELKDRLKASELLGKTEAMFTEKHIVASTSLEDMVLASFDTPDTVTVNSIPTEENHTVFFDAAQEVEVKRLTMGGRLKETVKMKAGEVVSRD